MAENGVRSESRRNFPVPLGDEKLKVPGVAPAQAWVTYAGTGRRLPPQGP